MHGAAWRVTVASAHSSDVDRTRSYSWIPSVFLSYRTQGSEVLSLYCAMAHIFIKIVNKAYTWTVMTLHSLLRMLVQMYGIQLLQSTEWRSVLNWFWRNRGMDKCDYLTKRIIHIMELCITNQIGWKLRTNQDTLPWRRFLGGRGFTAGNVGFCWIPQYSWYKYDSIFFGVRS